MFFRSWFVQKNIVPWNQDFVFKDISGPSLDTPEKPSHTELPFSVLGEHILIVYCGLIFII